jgi:branched-chain amino acid transport system substrate-binding protein
MKFTRRFLALSAAAAFFAAAGPAQAQIKIGFHAPLTGPTAADGKSSEIGAQMAVDWVNAAGGVLGQKLELVVYDDQGKPEQSIPLANKMIGQDKVAVAVSGGYSLPTRAAAPVFQKAGVPYFAAYAVHPDVTTGGNWAFRGVTLGPPQGAMAAKFIADQFGKKRVSVITMDNDFGQSIGDGFKKAAPGFGLTVLKEYTYSLKERQFGAIVAAVKDDKPDVIFASGYFFVAGPLVSQLRAAGLTQPIVGSQAFDSMQFIGIAKEAAEGVFVVGALGRDGKHADMEKFKAEFAKRAGHEMETVAANCYGAVMLVADAIKRAGSTDPKKIRDALAATKNFALLTGPMKYFGATGELYQPVEVSVVKGGTYRSFKIMDDPAILTPPSK